MCELVVLHVEDALGDLDGHGGRDEVGVGGEPCEEEKEEEEEEEGKEQLLSRDERRIKTFLSNDRARALFTPLRRRKALMAECASGGDETSASTSARLRWRP